MPRSRGASSRWLRSAKCSCGEGRAREVHSHPPVASHPPCPSIVTETVQAIYAAYATGDPDRIAALLHPDVIWVAPAGNATQIALALGSADDAGPPRSLNDLDRDAIVAFMAYDYPRFFANVAFEPRSIVSEGNVVLAEHRMSATLPNGRPYVNDYCFAYEVADGRVTAIREYMDTRGGWLQVFGDDPPEVLLEGTPPGS
jgi:uncharacterized protein